MDEADHAKILRHLLLTPAEALVLTRFSRDLNAAERTARNMMAPNAPKPFPFQLVVILGKRLVRRSEVLQAMGIDEKQEELTCNVLERLCPDNPTRKVGRPRKGGL